MQQGYQNFQQDYFKLAAMPFKIKHVPYQPPYLLPVCLIVYINVLPQMKVYNLVLQHT